MRKIKKKILKPKNQKEKSFTLLELLIVIAVIAILAAIVLVSLNQSKQSAWEARGLQFSQNIRTTLATDLVGEWTFDSTDIQGNIAKDTSGNGNNGTIYGATPTQGKIREALSFDGSDDYVDCGNGPVLNNISDEITIESWVIADDVISTKADTAILLKGAYTYGITRDERSGANNRIWTYLNSGSNNLSATISLKVWQHIVFTYNKNLINNQWKIYINGEVKNQRDFSQTITPSGNIFIAKNSTQYFKGTIDEVRIYNRALTAYEIKALYAEGRMRHLAGR